MAATGRFPPRTLLLKPAVPGSVGSAQQADVPNYRKEPNFSVGPIR